MRRGVGGGLRRVGSGIWIVSCIPREACRILNGLCWMGLNTFADPCLLDTGIAQTTLEESDEEEDE